MTNGTGPTLCTFNLCIRRQAETVKHRLQQACPFVVSRLPTTGLLELAMHVLSDL